MSARAALIESRGTPDDVSNDGDTRDREGREWCCEPWTRGRIADDDGGEVEVDGEPEGEDG